MKRFGINFGTLTPYDSGQMTQNLINGNPGFEGQIWNSTIRCAYGTATSCTDEDQYSGWAAGFWAGATYEVFYGASAGRTGTVIASSAAGYGAGVNLTFGDSGVAPAAGDYLILHMKIPGGATGGWAPYTYANGSITDNLTDLPPGTLGKQTIALSAPTQNDFATLSNFFDSTAGLTFVQLNGTYNLQFKAKGTGGGNQIYLRLTRYGVGDYVNQVVNLTNTWNTYNLTFTAAETGSAVGTIGLAFSTVGATSFDLDDVSLTQNNTDPTNTTVFRDPVVAALRTLQPGILRDWGGNGHLGETLDNFLTPALGRQRAGYSPFFQAEQIDYGLHDFLQLSKLVGAEPWFVVPVTFTATDASNLIEYLAGATTTPYGAKRAALGQTIPWTQVFPKIHLEFGNEAWNGTFKGGNIEFSTAYGQRAQTIFGLMRANPSFVAANFDLVLGGQAVSPGENGGIQYYCNNNDSFTIAPYAMNTVSSYSDNESLFGSTFAEAEAFMSPNGNAEQVSPGLVYGDYQAIQSSPTPVPLSYYEFNLSTLGGTITQQALNGYTSSLGAGLMVADTMLQSLRDFGIVNQNLFALPQYQFTRPDGSSAFLWGSVVDMGVTNRKRPQYLAVQLANQALSTGAAELQTVHTGADPTWDQPMVNTVQLKGAHYLQSFAFSQGTNLSVVVFNLSRSTALPVTFSGANAPSGTVQMQQLTSANLTDTNETANVVNIVPTTLNAFSSAAGLTLPPYSMTVLTWSNSIQAPVISSVSASNVTGTSATITWTTDQNSSTQVNYGTTTAYGSSSALNSALTTTHSASLTGLSTGTIYNYSVTSVNSNGNSSSSANFTFTTSAPAPVISAVTVSGITGNSATISWTTDQPSSSQVFYGTTTSYGSAALNSALVTSHSMTISGLLVASTYNFNVTSANSAGTGTTSPNYTFSTTGAAIISAVAVSSITTTSATITWTTDQPASSQVQYGTTLPYGSASTLNSNMVTSHSINLTGLTAGATYNYSVLSVNAVGLPAASPNLTFTTATGSPVISGVTIGGVDGTSATISWITDQSSTTLLTYGPTTSYGSSSTQNSTLSTSHLVTLTGLTPGTIYNFVAVSANSAGAAATSINYSFSTTGGPNISSVTTTAITGTTATINWTTDVASSSLVNYGTTTSYGTSSTLNSTLATSHSVTLTGLVPSTTYNYAVISANSAGSSAIASNFVFSTASQVPVISNVTVTGIMPTSVTVTWTTDQLTSSLVNYGTTGSYGSASTLNPSLVTNHSVTLTGLTAATTYSFDVVSANSAGTSATSLNSTFITAASGTPVISAITITAITSNSATVTWTTDQQTSSLVNFGTTTAYGSASALNSALVTSHSVILTGLLSGTTYNLDVVSANSANTSSTSANYTFATTAGTPVISAVAVTGITSTSATVTWTTDQATSSLVNYGNSTAYGSSSTLIPALVTSHSVTLTGLTAGTTYNFDVVSANSASASATSPNSTFATTVGTPVISAITVTSITSTSAIITWTTDQATSSLVNFGTTTAYGSASSSPTLVTAHSVALTGLTASTTYNFDVVSANSAGTSATSSNSTFVTTVGTPVISALSVTSITSNSATVTWTTDQATSSLVNYGTTPAYGSSSSPNAALVTAHSVTLTGLTASTTYNLDVVSANSAGTPATSPNSTFTTTAAAAPVISAVTVTAITTTSATVTWTTDQPSSSLVNYGSTSSYGSASALNPALVTSHSVTLTGLTIGTTYNFDVVSANAAGTSSTSQNSTFATLAGTPVISAVTVTAITSTSATVTWTTDQATSSLVNYGTTTAYGSASALNPALATAHSVSLTGLTAGTTYNFNVVSANSAALSATSPNSTFATPAGTPVISAVTVTAITSTSATVTWTTDQATSSLVNYGTTTAYGSASALNPALATAHSVSLTGLTAGTTYNFNVVSANSAGLSATSPNSTFATLAGTPVISAVTVTAITSTSATVTWTTDQATSSLVNYGTTTAYGSASALNPALATAHSVSLTGLTAGTTYNFNVVSANSAGLSATSQNSTFATLAGTPVISAVTVTAITSTSATVTWTTDQATSSLVNYGTTTAYGSASALNPALATAHSVSLTGLTAGTTYNFNVVSANSAGLSATSPNSTFATLAGTPVISAVTVTAITLNSATVTWNTNQATSSLVNYGTTTAYGSASTLNSSLVTSHSVSLTGLTAGTTYNFDVVSANSAGTSATSPNSTFATLTATPVISSVTVTAITSTSATVTWTTDQAMSSLVNYGTTAAYGSASTLNPTLVTAHSVALTGLTAGTTYNFDVVSVNSAGTSANSANSTFVTLAAAPVISAVTTTGITSTSATVTWTTSQAASSLVNYGTTTSYGSASALNSSLVTAHSVTLTGLAAGTTYNFDVVSANSAGATATSPNATFTTLAASATPPYVGYVAAWGINNSNATVTWSTDVAATTQLAYGTTTSLGQLSTLATAMTTSHGVTLTGLNSGTTYYFVAQSTAANGATGYSATLSFTTTGTASSPAPVISSVTATSITSTSAVITWNTDQSSTDQVNYGTTTSYGSSSAVSSTFATSHSVTLTGLTPGTAYQYDAVSANSSGTKATSANYSFTTTAAAAPVISAVTATSISSTSATITWTTDQPTTSLVNYGATTAYGSSSTLNTSLVTSHSVTLTGLTLSTTYNFDVVSVNSGGTSSTSANYTFVTSAAATPIISAVASTGITTTSATITWTTDQATSSQVNYGTTTAYGSSSALNSALVTSHSVTLTGLAAATTYQFDVVSANSAGKSATSTNATFVTTALAGTPVISSVTATSITSTSATITWTTDQATTSMVNYGTTTSYGSSSTLNTSLVTSHSVVLTGLTAGTTYNFDVVSANSANTSATSANSTFATPAASATPPTVSYVAYWGITSSGITISWSTNVAATTAVAFGTTSALGQIGGVSSSLVTSHGVTLTGLSAGTTYYFAAQSTAANGATGVSITYSFTTTGSSLPTISGLKVTPGNGNTAVASWTTSVPTYSYVQYGPTTSYNRYSSQSALTSSPQLSFGYVPSGLTHYQVVSTDAYGNQTFSADATFTEP